METALKSGWLYALAVAVLVLVAYGAHVATLDARSAKPEFDLARSQTTSGGLYVAAIEPEVADVKQGVLHSWVLKVKTADGQPVDDARVAIDGGMPEHNHGLPTSPRMTEYLGNGRYRIEGVKFSMSGRWELRFDISAAPGSDSVTFNLVL